MVQMLRIVFIFIFFLFYMPNNIAQQFITQSGVYFYKNNQPYYFLGANFWYGMNLASKGPGGNRERLIRELDRLNKLGINNLRIMAASEGPEIVTRSASPRHRLDQGWHCGRRGVE